MINIINTNYVFIISSNSIGNSSVSGFFLNENNSSNSNSSNNSSNSNKKKKNTNNDNSNNDNDNDDNISCMLIGVTGPFLRRLNALQVDPLMMTDKDTLRAVDFRKLNLDKQMQGCTGIT